MRIFSKFVFSAVMILPLVVFSNNPATRAFNPKTITTIKGTISQVNSTSKGGITATVMKVKTDTETLSVLVGPTWFIKKQGLNLKVNDTVEVTGSKTMLQSRSIIITTTIIKDGDTYTFRQLNGNPEWE